MKQCSKCKEAKDEGDFYKSSSSKDGRHCWCRFCCASYSKGYNSTEERKTYMIEWQRNYRKTQKAKDYDNQYRDKYQQTLSGLASKLYCGAHDRAKSKKLDFDIDTEWVMERLVPLVCEVTGMPLSLDKDKNYEHTYNRPSLDRIDSNKGYTKDNVQIVSVIYNKAKSDGILEHVIEMSKYLLEKIDGNS